MTTLAAALCLTKAARLKNSDVLEVAKLEIEFHLYGILIILNKLLLLLQS